MTDVRYKPDGYHTVTPYITVDGAAELVAFIQAALDGVEMLRLPGPEGRIGHAEMRVGDSVIMLADAPAGEHPCTAMLHLYVEDSDAVYQRALAQEATSVREPRNEFYGDRMSGVRDKFGNIWYFATHIEDLPEEEMARRAAAVAGESQ
ncbi:MAG: VOC family protein [Candidatus Dormibacteraeota bacterium]|nr:VOC family protein [Candidatus Dormibacteraeota bacterium]